MKMKTFQPKLFTALKSYSKKQLVSDLVAGLIVAIIALPLSIALAIASGVSPEKGLYTAIVAGFVIAFLGGSKVNISGPTAAFATIVAGIVASYGVGGLALATLMAGIILRQDQDRSKSQPLSLTRLFRLRSVLSCLPTL